jgi:hypothetical protein
MNPVLDRLNLRDLEKQDVRMITAWFQPPLSVMGTLQRQAKHLTPEAGDPLGVVTVDHDVLPAKGHDRDSSRSERLEDHQPEEDRQRDEHEEQHRANVGLKEPLVHPARLSRPRSGR